MKNAAKCLLFTAMLGIFAAPGARALTLPVGLKPKPILHFPFLPQRKQNKPQTAPEIDGSLAASGLALLSGCLVVVRARRKN